ERAHEADAGIDAFIDEFATGKPADENGASAAIALGATLLRAAQGTAQAQEIEQRLVGTYIRQRDLCVVEKKPDFVADIQVNFPCRSNSRRARRAAARGSVLPRPCRSGWEPDPEKADRAARRRLHADSRRRRRPVHIARSGTLF